jgi:membrane fusion protein, multidrug efflux system
VLPQLRGTRCITIDPRVFAAKDRSTVWQFETGLFPHLRSSSSRFAAVIAIGLASCKSRQDAKQPPPPPVVYVEPAARHELPLFVESVAALDGYITTEIRARVRGYLRTQDFKDGSLVKAGQVLFTIERSEFNAANSAARAGVSRAKAAENHDRSQLTRNQNLVREGVVSQQEVENSSANLHESAAEVRAAKADLAQAALNLSYTTVRSPISGVAGIPLIRLGNLVGQDGPTLLVTVSQVDPMRVTFPLSEIDYVKNPERFKSLERRDLGWARRQFEKLEAEGRDESGDLGIELVLSDGKPYAHRGVVIATDRQIDTTTGTIRLQALVPNPDGFLRPGQFGRVRIPQPKEERAPIAVQEKALINVQGTFSIAIVKPDNKVALRRVEVGPSAKGLRIVLSGLKEGERVIVEGVQKVAEGARVNPLPAPKSGAP